MAPATSIHPDVHDCLTCGAPGGERMLGWSLAWAPEDDGHPSAIFQCPHGHYQRGTPRLLADNRTELVWSIVLPEEVDDE